MIRNHRLVTPCLRSLFSPSSTARNLSLTATSNSVEAVDSTVNVKSVRESISEPSTSFHLFPAPKALVPPFDLSRKVANAFSHVVYQLAFEKTFLKEGVIRGANSGVALLGTLIADEDWSKMAEISTADLVEMAQFSKKRLSDESLSKLRFSVDDIVCSSLHSSIITGKDIFKLSASGNLGIYFTVISFVRLNESVPQSISMASALGKYRKHVMATNVTFGRTLNPLGPWKATALNFFMLDN